MITNLHHVAILTCNMEEAINYYTELLGCDPPAIAKVDKPGMKLLSALIHIGPSGSTYMQLIEPSEGPGVEELASGGEGTFESSVALMGLKRMMAARSNKVVYLGDSSKFGNRALVKVLDIDELDVVVTDEGVSAKHVGVLKNKGVDVLIG